MQAVWVGMLVVKILGQSQNYTYKHPKMVKLNSEATEFTVYEFKHYKINAKC